MMFAVQAVHGQTCAWACYAGTSQMHSGGFNIRESMLCCFFLNDQKGIFQLACRDRPWCAPDGQMLPKTPNMCSPLSLTAFGTTNAAMCLAQSANGPQVCVH